MIIAGKENVFFFPGLDKVQKNYSGVIDFYASKLCSTSGSLLKSIRSQILDVQDSRWPWKDYKQALMAYAAT